MADAVLGVLEEPPFTARREGLRSVAFPCLSTSAYGYPLALAARVALTAVREELEAHPGEPDEVRFVLFGQQALASYEEALAWLVGEQETESE